ncbi:uncharacterized protein DEA37_0007030 [Paragonimus westermani]|uniref:Reverse transcriptase domain-containing protein n=1 Tax=Paragonimus westermani TaxID=34504 RepID=A0A5J4N9J0_9TREM|nr:uncharacterized protein DEA37_0007030 [Paragonimus westermani]
MPLLNDTGQIDGTKSYQSVSAYKAAVHSSAGYTPSLLTLGHELRPPIEVLTPLAPAECIRLPHYVKELGERLKVAHKIAAQHQSKSQHQQKSCYDRTANVPVYRIGDHVWLYRPKPPLEAAHKFHRPWLGSFVIVHVRSPTVHVIRDTTNPTADVLTIHYNQLQAAQTLEESQIRPLPGLLSVLPSCPLGDPAASANAIEECFRGTTRSALVGLVVTSNSTADNLLATNDAQVAQLRCELAHPRTSIQRTWAPSRILPTYARSPLELKTSNVCWYHETYGGNARRYQSPCRRGLATTAPGKSSNNNPFSLEDMILKMHFSRYTGEEVGVNSHSVTDARSESGTILRAANGTSIRTFARRLLSLNFGLKHDFRWVFLVADIPFPILVRSANELPAVTTDFEHHMITRRPPVRIRPRRSASLKLRIPPAEFEHMLQLGIICQSNIPWTPSLHMMSEKINNDWRPCGDHRVLNSATTPSRCPIAYMQDLPTNLSWKKVFTKIDLVRVYNQIPVAPIDVLKWPIICSDYRLALNTRLQQRTCTTEESGMYCIVVLFQGLFEYQLKEACPQIPLD